MEIANALSAEEKPILENIVSLIQQLLSMQAGTEEAPAPEEPVMEGQDEDELGIDEPKVDKSTDGETGDDKAEDRLDEQTDTTDAAMDKLAKSLDMLNNRLGEKKTVKKTQNNTAMVALRKIEKSLEGIVSHQKEQDSVIREMLSAVSFSDDIINKSLPEVKKAEDKPVQRMDANFVKDLAVEIAKAVSGKQETNQTNPIFNKRDVNKNIHGLLNYVHDGTQRQRNR